MDAAAELDERPRRRARMTRQQRREHFLDVAAELVLDAGVDAVTMERVAARAGVSKALGYAYFDNSDDLLAALFDREMATYDAHVVAEVQAAATFEERVRASIVTMFEEVHDRGRLLGALLYDRGSVGALTERRQRHRGRAERFYADMLVAEFGLTPKQARTLATMWLAAGSAVIDAWIRCLASRRELTDAYVGLLVGGAQRLAAAGHDHGPDQE